MRKNLGSKAAIFPMPVLMVGTYDKEGNVDVMNAAWGMMADMNEVILNLTETHKTVKNIKETGCFTVSIADSLHTKEADYRGIVSGNNTPNKFQKSGLTAIKSEFVNAPIIDEFPIVMECKLKEFTDYGVVGEIVNVSVDEKILDSDEKIDPSKIHALIYK